MDRNGSLGLALIGVLALGGCGSTKFISTWSPPDLEPRSFAGQKVVALVLSSDESVRRGAELELAREISKRGPEGVPAYTLVPSSVLQRASDREAQREAKAIFEKHDIAAAVTMRVAEQSQNIDVTAGYFSGTPHYSSFWGGYWGYGWAAVYSPGQVRTQRVTDLETLIYDLKSDELIWAGMSRSTDPKNARALLRELAGKVAQQLRQAGVTKR